MLYLFNADLFVQYFVYLHILLHFIYYNISLMLVFCTIMYGIHSVIYKHPSIVWHFRKDDKKIQVQY